MSNIQRVSCNSMKKDAERLATELKDIPQIIDQLQASLKSLASCWDGPAWVAYQEQVTKDIEMMRDVYQTLILLQKELGTGKDIYLRTEHDVYTDIKYLMI